MDLTFFNPRSQSEADFMASFVARQSTLEFFLRQLRQLGAEEAARHHLIVAPRGFGKTSLLRRIAIAVRADTALRQRYIPLSFREEQHNVISLDVFWRNCLQSLLEAREEEHASEAELESIEAVWARMGPRQDLPREGQDGEPARHEFRSRCAELGRRPILLIDNLDALLAGLGNGYQWSLRQTLQEADAPVFVAAASRYPESTHDPAAAFFEFFRIHTLDSLNDAEVLACLRTLALHRGEAGKPVLALLDRDPGRVAALNTLAGGNPRTLGVLYGVLESHMSTDVLSQLSAMLDTFTGWYQARIEELPMQARAVFDALALNWDPMTAAALGQTTGLATAAVSSQLSRLEKLGYVEGVELSRRGKGRNGYQVIERFFNIWYLMRNGPRRARQSIRFLTVFLQSSFSPIERRSLGRRVLDAERTDPAYTVALATTIEDSRLRNLLLDRAHSASAQVTAGDDYQAMIRELRADDRAGLARGQFAVDDEEGRQDGVDPGADLVTQGQPAEGIAAYDNVVARFGDAPEAALRERVAQALFNKGVALGQLGRSDEAVAAYDNVVSRFGDAPEAALREQVAGALVNKGVALGQLGRSDEAVAAYDNVVARFGDAPEAALRERVARALFNKGITLGQLGRSDEEVAAYDNVVARFGDAPEAALREPVARALFNKGITLGQLGRSDEEVAAYDNVVARFGDAPEAALREGVARALFNKGITLGQLGRRDEEVAAYDNVVARFGDAPEAALREQVARALVNKGITLGQLGRSDEEVAAYDNVVARFGDAPEAALREQVAWALFNKGITLGQLGRSDEAVAAYDNVVARFGDAPEAALREPVARALVNKGVALGQLGRSDEEVAAYDNVVARFGDAPEAALRERVARALVNKGVALGQLGRSDEAVAAYDNVVARFGDAPEAALREGVGRALVNKGVALGRLGRSDEEVAAYDNVVARFGDAPEAALRERVARALVNKGITLGQLGRSDEEVAAYDNVVARFGDAPEAALREQVGQALWGVARAKLESGQVDAAETDLRRGIKYGPGGANLWIALGNLLLDNKGDPEAAESAYREGLAVAETDHHRAILHANSAYVLALYFGDHQRAQEHIRLALAVDQNAITPAGRALLSALPTPDGADETGWACVFSAIGRAVESRDSALWSDYLNDLQRLLWFTIAHKRGDALRAWMESAEYPLRQAPLYHAVVAAIEGEDHLLTINPETRAPAERIYEGIARRLNLHARQVRGPGRGARQS